ncbi:hypothetical protein QVD17_28613 [Tagetes erecta]|uniref:Sucrose synthase first GT-B domain-containing protein n=1 Tax=Tagetes erecta TaxID=13708 RepID=A0AAD8NSW7_TARER|nr:hypothetical protein QVD17_28613 [Tagetes erecta]
MPKLFAAAAAVYMCCGGWVEGGDRCIAHALEKTKYLDSDSYWKNFEEKTFQEIAGRRRPPPCKSGDIVLCRNGRLQFAAVVVYNL